MITIGIAIQTALQRQKRVLEAVQAIQKYAGDLLAANAASVRQQGAEIQDLHKNPVLALDKVIAAYDDLTGAIEDTAKSKEVGIAHAKDAISQLSKMSTSLQGKVEQLRAAKAEAEKDSTEEEIGSVEA